LGERPNCHPLHLPTEFYLGITDVMSKMRIGKSAAILWILNEGLRKHGYIEEETYEIYRRKYSTSLMKIVRDRRKKKAEAGIPKPRCQWAARSADKCRRLAQVLMKRRDQIVNSCPEHIAKFREHGFKVVESES
jgi:hypothetical protein